MTEVAARPSASLTSVRPRLTGLVPPIPTPLSDGRLDVESLRRLLDALAPHISGVLVGGSVGEVASLTIDERLQLIRVIADHVNGALPLAVSISDNALGHSRLLAEAAGEAQAALVIAMCPNYYQADSDMLAAYFAALAEFVPAEICLYDNPIASQHQLSVEDIAAIHGAAPKVTHIKVTDTALDKVAQLRGRLPLAIYAGDDAVLWHQLRQGVDGAMVALPMTHSEDAAAVWTALAQNDAHAARECYRAVSDFIHVALGARDYVAVIKAVLHRRGLISSPEVRLPLQPLAKGRLAEVLTSIGGPKT